VTRPPGNSAEAGVATPPGAGAETALIVPTPLFAGTDDVVSGPVVPAGAVGLQAVWYVVNVGTTSDIVMLLMLFDVVLVPTTR